MERLLIILFAVIVTTPSYEARSRPKVVFYEILKREKNGPELQVFSVNDDNLGEQQDEYQQLYQILNSRQENRNSHKQHKHEKLSSKRNRNSHQNSQSRYKKHRSSLYKNIDKLQSNKERDNYYSNQKQRNDNKNENDYLVNFLIQNSVKDSLDNNRDSENNNRNKQTYKYNQDSQYDQENQYNNMDDQLTDYIKQLINRNGKQQQKQEAQKYSLYSPSEFAEDYVDLSNREAEEEPLQTDVLLAQLLKQSIRKKREAEKSGLIQRLQQFVQRLQEVDSEGEAKLDGKVYITSLDNLGYSRDQKSGVNEKSVLRTGDNAQEEEDFGLDFLGLDRNTMPPPPRESGKFARDD